MQRKAIFWYKSEILQTEGQKGLFVPIIPLLASILRKHFQYKTAYAQDYSLQNCLQLQNIGNNLNANI